MPRYGSKLPPIDISNVVYLTLEHNTRTPQQVIGVAVRLFAIWLVLLALQVSITGIELHLQASSGDTVVTYFFSGFYIIVAVLLWLFPMAVAHSLHSERQLRRCSRHSRAASHGGSNRHPRPLVVSLSRNPSHLFLRNITRPIG